MSAVTYGGRLAGGAGGAAPWGAARRALGTLGALALLTGAGPAARGGVAHPLHSTLTTLAYRAETRSVEITMRVFADDFRAALAGRGGAPRGSAHPVRDSAAFAYVSATFALADGRGARLALHWRGVRREGDVLWLSLSAPARGLAGLQVWNALLCEVYEDQVNIVQAVDGARRGSVLFTRGDGAKRIL